MATQSRSRHTPTVAWSTAPKDALSPWVIHPKSQWLSGKWIEISGMFGRPIANLKLFLIPALKVTEKLSSIVRINITFGKQHIHCWDTTQA